MRSALLAVLVAALVAVPSAAAGKGLLVGVDDDQAKWIGHPMVLLPVYKELGVKAVRVNAHWRPGESSVAGTDFVMVHRVTVATWGLRLVLAVDGPAADPPLDPVSRGQYCSYVASILQSFPSIHDVVIWTEPNNPTFWRPQTGAAAAYEALLARCWDALHAVEPSVNVIAASAPHAHPIAWYVALGDAYRKSGRKRPIFDTVGHNAYPETSAESPAAVHSRDVIDEGDYDRFMQVLQQAFDGTTQPIPGQNGVTIWYMEDGFQSRVVYGRNLYTGSETDKFALDEQQQGRQLAAAVRLAYCEPNVGAFFNFELRDETSLKGWQSGVVRANWSPKPSYFMFRDAIIDVLRGNVDCSQFGLR
jgi:hypothetical protein